jgi:hypothetical protein
MALGENDRRELWVLDRRGCLHASAERAPSVRVRKERKKIQKRNVLVESDQAMFVTATSSPLRDEEEELVE